MKSTDMFLSAEDRKTVENSIVLSSSQQPKGLAPSPFVVSLWETKKIPQKKEAEIHDEELQTIEDLFRGNGRISPLETESSHPLFPSSSRSHSSYSQYENNESQPLSPKEIVIPSRQEQLKTMKNSKNEYSAIFQKPSAGGSGFFRNFAFWK